MTSDGEPYYDYQYWYPEEPKDLMGVFDALTSLFTSDGITLVNNSDCAAPPEAAIRLRFSEGAILFGGIKFAECSAFLDYQSKNSSAVIDTYYGELLSNGEATYIIKHSILRPRFEPRAVYYVHFSNKLEATRTRSQH